LIWLVPEFAFISKRGEKERRRDGKEGGGGEGGVEGGSDSDEWRLSEVVAVLELLEWTMLL
jgi:hypothetical protein